MGHPDERGSNYIFIIDNFLFKQKQFLAIMSIGAQQLTPCFNI
jgi:hypothetical protein